MADMATSEGIEAMKVVGWTCQSCGSLAHPLATSLSYGAWCLDCWMERAISDAKRKGTQWNT